MFESLPSLNALKVFTVAAEVKSFKLAASKLSITPTAVSHQIKSLENQLNVTLFERKVRAVNLTPEGEELAQQLLLGFMQIEKAVDKINRPKNKITISCCHSFAALFLVPNLSSFSSAFPDINIEICASDELVDLEQDHRIDIAIRYGQDTLVEGEKLLIKEKLGVYKSTLHTNLKPSSKESFFITKWNEGELKNIEIEEIYFLLDFKLITFNQEHYVLQSIIAGQGRGVLSNVLAYQSLKSGLLSRDDSYQEFSGYAYSYRVQEHRKNEFRINRFIEWLEFSFNNL